MSGDLFAPRRRAEDRARAAVIKRRVALPSVIALLGLGGPRGALSPCCGALDALICSPTGHSAHCESCAAVFDAISLVRAARGCGFAAACAFLETEADGASRCAATGDLLAPSRAGRSA